MPVAVGAATRRAAFDVIRLRLGRFRNRIATFASISVIALRPVRDERDGNSGLGRADAHVRNAIRRRAEVRMQPAIASDEIDEGGRLRIDRRARDVLIPPVARWKERSPTKVIRQLHRASRRRWRSWRWLRRRRRTGRRRRWFIRRGGPGCKRCRRDRRLLCVAGAAYEERANNDGEGSRRTTRLAIGFRQSQKTSNACASGDGVNLWELRPDGIVRISNLCSVLRKIPGGPT